MKTILALVLALVLTASLLVGCGCTNRNIEDTSAPTVLPTNEEIWNTTEPTTRSTTEGTTGSMPTENGTGGMDNHSGSGSNNSGSSDSTINTTEGSMESRAQRMMPGRR